MTQSRTLGCPPTTRHGTLVFAPADAPCGSESPSSGSSRPRHIPPESLLARCQHLAIVLRATDRSFWLLQVASRHSLADALDRHPRRPPVRQALGESFDPITARAEERHRLV